MQCGDFDASETVHNPRDAAAKLPTPLRKHSSSLNVWIYDNIGLRGHFAVIHLIHKRVLVARGPQSFSVACRAASASKSTSSSSFRPSQHIYLGFSVSALPCANFSFETRSACKRATFPATFRTHLYNHSLVGNNCTQSWGSLVKDLQ